MSYELVRFIDNKSPIYALSLPAGLAEKGFTLAKVVGYAVAYAPQGLATLVLLYCGVFIGRAFSLIYSQTSAGEWIEDRLCCPDRYVTVGYETFSF